MVKEDFVIEVLTDFPDNVTAIVCHGHVNQVRLRNRADTRRRRQTEAA